MLWVGWLVWVFCFVLGLVVVAGFCWFVLLKEKQLTTLHYCLVKNPYIAMYQSL